MPSAETPAGRRGATCRAYVWAEVDLGFQLFFSSPFELGQLKPVAKQRRWGPFRGWRSEKEAKPAEDQPPEETAGDDPPPAASSEEETPAPDDTRQNIPPPSE